MYYTIFYIAIKINSETFFTPIIKINLD